MSVEKKVENKKGKSDIPAPTKKKITIVCGKGPNQLRIENICADPGLKDGDTLTADVYYKECFPWDATVGRSADARNSRIEAFRRKYSSTPSA